MIGLMRNGMVATSKRAGSRAAVVVARADPAHVLALEHRAPLQALVVHRPDEQEAPVRPQARGLVEQLVVEPLGERSVVAGDRACRRRAARRLPVARAAAGFDGGAAKRSYSTPFGRYSASGRRARASACSRRATAADDRGLGQRGVVVRLEQLHVVRENGEIVDPVVDDGRIRRGTVGSGESCTGSSREAAPEGARGHRRDRDRERDWARPP